MARLEAACDVERFDGAGAMPHGELVARLRGKHALISMVTDAVDRTAIGAGHDLRVIANVAVGYNNIDVAAARECGIIVTNTPDVLTDATASFTWALILAITRRLNESERLLRRGDWRGWALDFMLGTDLRGKQLGIVGFGRIGGSVAARAAAFGMHVACAERVSNRRRTSNSHPASDSPGSRPPGVPDAVAMSLDRLLSTSDIVSLHVPLNRETHHLIDQPALARMKRTAYLINTSRGSVVDEAALAWALTNRLIAGAALDVYENEPVVHPDLLLLENVLLTPHLGSGTTETRTAMADLAARNVLAVLADQPPLTPIP